MDGWAEWPAMKPVPAARLCVALLVGVLSVYGWSALAPFDRFTWWLETIPVGIGLALLMATWRRFPLTALAYVLIAIHMGILCVGGHYTYARVPFFDGLGEWLGQGRNNYDKLGHFWQGFGPAIVARELLLRTSPLRPGKWLFCLVLCSALALSATYELIEWAVAAGTATAAEDFLGTQGDVWDTQKDMAWCGFGALMALLCLGRLHDRQLARLGESMRRDA
jgi:putative membrane protein